MNKVVKNRKVISCVLVVVIALVMMIGCGQQASRVSHNISKQADNFNVMRRFTVINTRTDKCMLQMTGRFSIQNEGNNELAVIVELDRSKNMYQKHFVYLNEWTTYTVEDLNGVKVSKYDYELEFMPQTLIPVRVTADELKQDFKEVIADDE